jgi:hypothetical protein
MLVLALLAAAVSPGARDLAIPAPKHWTWRGSLPEDAFIDVRGVTGDIRALPSENGRVEVSARFEETSGIDVRVTETPAGLIVCAVRKGSQACPAEPGTGPAGRVDYDLRVPRGVKLIARTVNGGIQADSLASDVQATTINGGVVISTSGTAEASTVNGSIVAKLLRPFWRKAPQFSAVNGRISILIPPNVKTAIKAETRNGRIVNSLSAFRGSATEQKLEGTVGTGGGCNPLIIRTINGPIELKQRS